MKTLFDYLKTLISLILGGIGGAILFALLILLSPFVALFLIDKD